MVSHAFSALCVYSKSGHHPHPLGYLCAKVCLFRGLSFGAVDKTSSSFSAHGKIGNFIIIISIAELAHGEKLRTHSITHLPSLFDAPI